LHQADESLSRIKDLKRKVFEERRLSLSVMETVNSQQSYSARGQREQRGQKQMTDLLN